MPSARIMRRAHFISPGKKLPDLTASLSSSSARPQQRAPEVYRPPPGATRFRVVRRSRSGKSSGRVCLCYLGTADLRAGCGSRRESGVRGRRRSERGSARCPPLSQREHLLCSVNNSFGFQTTRYRRNRSRPPPSPASGGGKPGNRTGFPRPSPALPCLDTGRSGPRRSPVDPPPAPE